MSVLKILAIEPTVKIHLRKLRSRWEDSIRMDLKEIDASPG